MCRSIKRTAGPHLIFVIHNDLSMLAGHINKVDADVAVLLPALFEGMELDRVTRLMGEGRREA